MADGFSIMDNFSMGDLFGNTGDYGTIAGAIGDNVGGIEQGSYLGNVIGDYASGGSDGGFGGFGGLNLGSLPVGNILGTLGRLGSGIGTGVASYQSQKQPNYIPYTRWLGNGLATTGYLNNAANKKNQLDQYVGTGNMLSNLFGQGFSLFGNGKNNEDALSDVSDNGGYANLSGDINRNVMGIVQDPDAKDNVNLYARYSWLR